MKVDFGIRMGRQKFHTPIGQVLCHDIPFGRVDATNIPNGGVVAKTRLDLFGILLVDPIKIGSNHMFHGLLFGCVYRRCHGQYQGFGS